MSDRLTEKDMNYLRNINTSPGPNAGRSIDPAQLGPDADRIAEVEREIAEFPPYGDDCGCASCVIDRNKYRELRAELARLRNKQPKGGDAVMKQQPDSLTHGPGSAGEDAVADCPDCDGEGYLDPAPSSDMREVLELAISAVEFDAENHSDGYTYTISRDALDALLFEARKLIEAADGFAELRQANVARNVEWTKGNTIALSPSFRGNELAGEVGEACNVLKKIERERLGLVGSRATVEQLVEELADIIICADLTAMDFGIDLFPAVRDKFNATSNARGLQTKIRSRAADRSAPRSDKGGA